MRIGKYITVGDYDAEIVGKEPNSAVFVLKGFILGGRKRLIHTAWSEAGKNIEKSKWDLK